jgi:ATP phosphoribosyltransferase
MEDFMKSTLIFFFILFIPFATFPQYTTKQNSPEGNVVSPLVKNKQNAVDPVFDRSSILYLQAELFMAAENDSLMEIIKILVKNDQPSISKINEHLKALSTRDKLKSLITIIKKLSLDPIK